MEREARKSALKAAQPWTFTQFQAELSLSLEKSPHLVFL